jgi:hypothetical protein
MVKTALSAWTESTAALLGDIRARKQRIKHQYADLKSEWQMIEAEETALAAAVEAHNARVRRFPELTGAAPTRIDAPKPPDLQESKLRALPTAERLAESGVGESPSRNGTATPKDQQLPRLVAAYAVQHANRIDVAGFSAHLVAIGRYPNDRTARSNASGAIKKMSKRGAVERLERGVYQLTRRMEASA